VTMIIVIIRHLRDVHYTVVTVIYGIQGTVICGILVVVYDVFELPQTPLEWSLVVGLSLLTWGGQTGLVLALQLEQCAVVSLINSLDTCFAFILQFIFLGVIPDMYSVTGASIVLTGVIVTTFRKYLSGLPEDNKTRQRFRLILK